MPAEKEPRLKPIETSKGFKEQPVPHPKTLEFLKTAIENQAYYVLSEDERKLIGMYYFLPGSKLKDLRSFVHPQTGAKVKLVIFGSLEKVWENLSQEEKERFPKKDVIKMKHQSYSSEHIARMKLGPSDKTREKLSIKGKRVGFSEAAEINRLKKIRKRKRPQNVKNKISTKLIGHWENPQFRERMLKSIKERNPNRLIWEAAEAEDITSKIINQGVMTQDEINSLRSYFQRKVKKNENIDNLLERFSIAVANLA